MIRRIIKIDETKCDGCGLCADACHEGAIKIIDGKAKLTRDDFCDGLGNCLPVCPVKAISFEEREAAAFNEEAVKAKPLSFCCPGTMSRSLDCCPEEAQLCPSESNPAGQKSELRQWPVQIKLVPVNAHYFNDAHLLICADCCAYSCGSFHHQYMKDKITIIGCPKLDNAEYTEKLAAIIKNNNIKSVTVTKMEVPCCAGLEHAASAALNMSGKTMPYGVFTLPVS
ncbi:MAG: 4Fe-4S binding protein [Treponema sp.]|nr:4Fe-4S binding protein [Treponema sp.]